MVHDSLDNPYKSVFESRLLHGFNGYSWSIYVFSCCDMAKVRAWFMNAKLIPESRYLSPDYFVALIVIHGQSMFLVAVTWQK